tara:strand:- start:1811 stop:2182 length:372 start_codon:yes stop_codon:yes gene_type:complete
MEVLFFLTMLTIASVFGALIIIFVKLLLKSKTPQELVQDSKSLIEEAKESGSYIYKNLIQSDENILLDADEELFVIANKEIETSTQNEGMWVKSLILAEGDHDHQKIEYIKLRVAELNKKNEI